MELFDSFPLLRSLHSPELYTFFAVVSSSKWWLEVYATLSAVRFFLVTAKWVVKIFPCHELKCLVMEKVLVLQ